MNTSLLKEFTKAIKANDVKKVVEMIKANAGIVTTILPYGFVSIHVAAKNGCFDVLHSLLEEEPTLINITDDNNQTALLWAASIGHDEMVEYLAHKGADLNLPTRSHTLEDVITPIHWAILNGHDKVVASLIKLGASLDVRWGVKKWTLVHIASKKGDLKSVSMLLEALPNYINAQDENNSTPLSVAVASGHEMIVKMIVALGADLKIPGLDKYLPIHIAIQHGHLPIFKYLQPLMSNEDACLGSNCKQYIHLAVYHGQQDIIAYLLEQDPSTLEKCDKYDLTPLFYTAYYDEILSLKLLLEKGANLDARINKPGDKCHGMTVLDYAHYLKSYKIVNCLLLKMHADEGRESIIKLIQNGTQALELMLDKPDFIPLILKDERLVNLISTTSACSLSQNTIGWYQPSKKRHSFFISINKNTNQLSNFKPEKEIGVGGFATVRLFKSDEGETIAVKTPKDNKYGFYHRQKELKNELNFNKLAYPSETYAAFEFPGNFDYRFVMPYVDAKTVRTIFLKTTCHAELAHLILLMATELQRLHDLRILHKDIHENNIMISQDRRQVRFIDFGSSCSLTKDNILYIDNQDGTKWYPPELCINSTDMIPNLKPHANQDIYSFGFLLNKNLANHACYQTLIASHPIIDDFINKALNVNPQKRPQLALFCQTLKTGLSEACSTFGNSI